MLDEAQLIASPTAKRTIAVGKLKSHVRMCLTGTPMMNCRRDLVSLCVFLGAQTQFAKDNLVQLRSLWRGRGGGCQR